MRNRLAFITVTAVYVSLPPPAHADIPVVDGTVETERTERDSLTTQNRDVGKKTYGVTASVTCSMYKKGNRDDPASAANANPEIAGMVRRVAQEEGVNETQLLALVYQESRFNPCAKSAAGAIGLAQLMPDTASELGVNPYSIEDNIRGGARYYKQQLRRYNGNVNLALAAYNAGAGNVNKWGGIPPFKETQGYVANITEKWIPALGRSDVSNIPVNYGGGTAAFSGARATTVNAFAKTAAIGDSSANVSSWLQQLGSTQTGAIQDSWDQNSAARAANIEMFNQMAGLGETISDLINARNSLSLSGLSGASESLNTESAEDQPKVGFCDERQDLVWDAATKTCVIKTVAPENPNLQLTPSN
jgi:hypothetical protein